MVPINLMAILVAAIAAVILGSVWYGPLFGKKWMHLMGIAMNPTPENKRKMMKSYVLMFIGTLLMAYVLAHVLIFSMAYMNTAGLDAGITAGIWVWLGFVAPTTVGMVLWEGKPWKLWFIVAGYYLVSIPMMGVILALWT